MVKYNSLKISGGLTLICGIGHTLTHIIMATTPSPSPDLMSLMQSTKVRILIERSVFDYHQGFSLAMGIMLIGLGLQIIIGSNKKGIKLNLVMVGLIALISIVYFHPIAIGLMSMSFLLLLSHFSTTKYN